MKKILVPTDFSPSSLKALDFAVQIAKCSKGEIILIHACTEMLDTEAQSNRSMYTAYNEARSDKARAQLSMIKESIENAEQVMVTTKVYEGSVEETILQVTEDTHADLTVMGTLGNTGMNETLFGSVSASIIGKTTVPLLIIPPLSEWEIPKKLLLVVNHFKTEEENTAAVFQLAQLFNASVYIGFFTEDYSDESELTLDQEQTILNYRQTLETKYPRISIRAFHIGGHLFKETIEDYIEQKSIDMVAMVTYKRTFLQGLFHPSMTKKMSYSSHIPLLAIPARSTAVSGTK